MNELLHFKHNLFSLSVITKEGEASYDVETVARSLGFTQVAKSGNEVVRWERVNKYLGESSPHVGTGDFIQESMVYKLAFKANNEVAEQFQDWLAVEVIPAIRKFGGYLTPNKIEEAILNPDILIQLATTLKREKEKNILLERQILEAKPQLTYLESILNSKDTLTITQVAEDYGMTAIALNMKLKKLRIQRKVNNQWVLYAMYKGRGLTKSETFKVGRSKGATKVVTRTRWTQKGRLFIHDLLEKEGVSPLADVE